MLLFGLVMRAHAQTPEQITLYFTSGSYQLDQAQYVSLQQFLTTLSTDSTCSLTIDAFCDSIGSASFNKTLSEKRLATVRQVVEQAAIFSASNIKGTAHGASGPIADNATEAGRRLNRRVELTCVCKPKKPDLFNKAEIFKPGQIVKDIPEFSLAGNVRLDSALISMRIGDHLVLRDITFPLSMDSIAPDVFPILDSLAAVLLRNPQMRIRLEGHICCTNTEGKIAGQADAINIRTFRHTLSTDRARAVFAYLRLKDVPAAQMEYIGLSGKNKLIAPEFSEEDYQRNRRVEIVLLYK